MGRRRILGDRQLTTREAVSRHRARLDALGDVRVEMVISRQTLRMVDREANQSCNSRAKELRALVEEALARRAARRTQRG